MARFKVGDAVQWTSQAGGTTKTKAGHVIAVIPGGRGSGSHANRHITKRTNAGTHRSAFGGGWDRVGDSYLVEVKQGSSGRAKPVLYWPVASKLQPA